MNEFKAVSDRQLGICLRMLYAEKIGFSVKVTESARGKINFLIGVLIDEQTFEMLDARYKIMIS